MMWDVYYPLCNILWIYWRDYVHIQSIFEKPKTNVFILYLLSCENICSKTIYLSLNKLTSKVWKKNCPKFLYTLYEARRKSESGLSHSFLAVFPLLNKFVLKKKCLWVAGFLQSGALYATNTHDPRSVNNQRKSEHSKRQRSWGVWGCF